MHLFEWEKLSDCLYFNYALHIVLYCIYHSPPQYKLGHKYLNLLFSPYLHLNVDFHCSLTFDKIGHLSTSTHVGVLQDYSHPSHSEFITSFWSSPPWCRNDANTWGTYACCLYLCLLYLLIFVISTAKYECKLGTTWLIQWSWSWIALCTHLRTINMDTGDPASLAVFPGHNLISGTDFAKNSILNIYWQSYLSPHIVGHALLLVYPQCRLWTFSAPDLDSKFHINNCPWLPSLIA